MNPRDVAEARDATIPLPVMPVWRGFTFERVRDADPGELPHILSALEMGAMRALARDAADRNAPSDVRRALDRIPQRLPFAWRPGTDEHRLVLSAGKLSGRLATVRRLLEGPDREVSRAKRELWTLYCDLTDPDRARGRGVPRRNRINASKPRPPRKGTERARVLKEIVTLREQGLSFAQIGVRSTVNLKEKAVEGRYNREMKRREKDREGRKPPRFLPGRSVDNRGICGNTLSVHPSR